MSTAIRMPASEAAAGRLWRAARRSVRLRTATGVILGVPLLTLILGPLLFLGWQGLELGAGEFLARARDLDVPRILGNVLLLAVLTTGFSTLTGLPLAWLVARSDLPGRNLVRLLAPLPLALPPYIGAIVYQILMAPGGVLGGLAVRWLGVTPSLVASLIYGVWGAAWVLTLFMFPYVYLLSSAALERMNPSLEEAARATGMGGWRVFWRVTLPLLRPALLGAGLMIFLYAWADFGVVSLLRMRTLTTVIYDYVSGTMDWGIPAGLSLALTAITGLALLTQLRILGRAGYAQINGSVKPMPPVRLGRWRPVALLFVIGILGASLGVPLTVLAVQSLRLGLGGIVRLVLQQWPFILNSLWTSLLGATLVMVVAFVTGWLEARRGQRKLLSPLCQIGYAIPGTVLGLGMVGFFSAALPWVYSRPAVIVMGYLVLFLTPALQAVKAALAQLGASLEEAARGLGRTPLEAFREVTFPLLRPGLVGGWTLVFILCMRELAATLILRPPGFDTLPVRVWIHTMDVGPEPAAATLALLLVGLIALPWLGLILFGRRMVVGW